jgi:hypothetical protein
VPTREELAARSARYEEALVVYETARAEFEALETAIREHLDRRAPPTPTQENEDDAARARLFVARVQLTRHAAARSEVREPLQDGGTNLGQSQPAEPARKAPRARL